MSEKQYPLHHDHGTVTISRDVFESMTAELERLRPMECGLELAEADRDAYKKSDYIDADILGYKINEKLIQYAPSGRTSTPCEECRQKSRFLYDGLCLPCYKKKLQKANEIKRSFEAEGWKEVPEAERENAISGNCWIDERNMDPMEPRKGTRFFIIDTKQLKWSCYFRTQIKKV